LLEAYGSPAAVLAQAPTALARRRGIGAKLAELLGNWSRHVDPAAERAEAERAGVRIITLADDDYPALLRRIHDPPVCLYVAGEAAVLAETEQRALAVVGSRRTSHYGERMAERLTRAGVFAGWIVVSGLARGIDTVAHRVCLDAGGRTIAVLAGGLARLYPPENIELARAICAQGGCLLSEMPMRMVPDRRNFPMRNRIIAGLSLGTLVVEAGVKSGALITAKLAAEQGRQVFAVPGQADMPGAQGCHQLIREGAALCESLDDVMEEFSLLPNLQAEAVQTEPEPTPDLPGLELELSPEEARVVEVLQQGECQLDELLQRVDQPVHSLLTLLMGLELRRIVEQLPGRRFTLRR